jgi:hypothetical protein
MDWTTKTAGRKTILVGVLDGQEVVSMTAQPRMAAPGQGFEGWTITKLVITPSKRGDDSFTEQMIPEIMERVKEQGWMTDEDLLNYRWEDDGLHVGSLHVMSPKEFRNRLLAQRVVMRDEVDKIAAVAGVEVAEPLTPEVVEVIEYANGGEA